MKKILLIVLLLIVGYSQNPLGYFAEDGWMFFDVDGNSYKTVKIGNQIWMDENLKVTHYRNGDPIPNITNDDEWVYTEQGAYCNYDNDENNVKTYGRLYNWFSVNDKRRLAPKGWHIPTDEEWEELVDYLGGDEVAGGKLKSIGTIQNGDGLWSKPNKGATNESRFTGLPGGYRLGGNDYYYMGFIVDFWSSTEDSRHGGSGAAWGRNLYYGTSEVGRNTFNKKFGFSVRCIKD